jgi:[ribosomal protein S5]-alanine N-acetyltransferase
MLIETRRLRLRPMQFADIPALVSLWTDPEVTRFLGGPRDTATLTANLEETARDPLAEPYDLYPLEEKATGNVVGHCGLLDKEVDGKTEIELVYVLTPSVWGRGYATEMAEAVKTYAFEQRGVRRLIALIEPENEASAKVAIKAGMRLEKEVIRPGGAVRRIYAVEAESLIEKNVSEAVTRKSTD